MNAIRSLAVFAALACSPALFAQMAPPPGAGMDPQMQELMTAQMRVMAAQKKAIEDPALKKELDGLQKLSEDAMIKSDPSLKADMKKYHALEKQLDALTLKGKSPATAAEAQKLMGQLRPLAQKLGAAQKKTLDDPKIRKAFEAFDAKVQKKMAQIDPEVPALIKKLEAAAKARGMGHGAPGGAR